ncbi:creatininase family protein [Nonomuraea sp. NPDC049646]|uniref:creatininase family protein n=1 Tax=unclassified Nonomuraea TaxID=2593643 RepID=UPI0037BB92CA
MKPWQARLRDDVHPPRTGVEATPAHRSALGCRGHERARLVLAQGVHVLPEDRDDALRDAHRPASGLGHARAAAQLSSSMHEDMHAGEIETSILLHACPEVIRPGHENADHVANERRHLLSEGMQAKNGVIGRPILRDSRKGQSRARLAHG